MTLHQTDWAAAAEAEQSSTIALRRAIHADPELGLDCHRTTTKLKAALAGLPLTMRDSKATSGFVARLDGAKPGRTVLLRGDMDALPIDEETGLDFASQSAGHMHACGHDTHSAMLAGAARILAERREQIAGTILFMFQPGEEGLAGARHMIDEGLLDDPTPEAAFAIHVFPNVPGGIVACREGALLAATDLLTVTVHGKGGHAAMPHDALDPIPVACEIVLALQSFIARRTTFTDPAILSITQFNAGSAHNIIPDSVNLVGTLRTLSEKTRREARAAFERIATNIAEAHGLTAEPRVEAGYPATLNDPRAVALVRACTADLFGEGAYHDIPSPIMGGEDFAFVLQKVSGAMAILGVAPPQGDPSARPPIHNSKMLVDETALARGVALHCAFATRFLEQGLPS
ncbi:MAG: M20 family metallopeptidase [Pseudomonadota bacterium]|nr:M20 family metallopeptidase [Pseudomonadota bacterium]